MSSGLCMYKLRPVITNDAVKLQTTHNMYKLRPINGNLDNAPLVTMGNVSLLESRQEEILKKLNDLKLNMKNLRDELNSTTMKSSKKCTTQGVHSGQRTVANESCQPCQELNGVVDIVVCAGPQYPPYSLPGLVRVWGPNCPLQLRSYTHSSVAQTPDVAKLFSTGPISGKACLTITVVWKDVGHNAELIVSPLKHVTIRGEMNILRFLSRVGPSQLSYENESDIINETKVDELLDMCETLVSTGNNREKQSVIRSISASLGKGQWMFGKQQLGIADIAVWSVFKQVIDPKEIPQSMTNWFEQCNSILGIAQG